MEATARPAARERGWGCGRPAALSFTALVGTGFKPAGWVNDGRSGRRLSFIALVGTGFKPVPPSVFLRQGAVATIHELLANIGCNPVPPSVFLRQTWRPPQGPQRGSGRGCGRPSPSPQPPSSPTLRERKGGMPPHLLPSPLPLPHGKRKRRFASQ